jgi:hypothetical protein
MLFGGLLVAVTSARALARKRRSGGTVKTGRVVSPAAKSLITANVAPCDLRYSQRSPSRSCLGDSTDWSPFGERHWVPSAAWRT